MQETVKPNYYEILQLQPYANPALITAAYRVLSKIYHPDTAKEQANLDKFRLLQQAYETLSDPRLRQEYDSELRLTMPGSIGFGYGYRPDPEERAPLWETMPDNQASSAPPSEEELEFYKDLYDYGTGSKRRRTIMLIVVYIFLMSGATICALLGFMNAFGTDSDGGTTALIFFAAALLLFIIAHFEAYFS